MTDPTRFDPRTLFTVGVLLFPLMTFTLGVSLPSGIFMPTILVGCSLGGFAGICFQDYLMEGLSPSTFALLGAAALLTGIQRSTVSVCVILVEGTGQTKFLIPVICTIVVARYVGDFFTKGLYEVRRRTAATMQGQVQGSPRVCEVYADTNDALATCLRLLSKSANIPT